MSDLSINSEARFLLNGVQINAPLEWQDIQIVAEYEEGSIQPSLAIEEFSFPLEARDLVNKWISDGLMNGVGIFEGMPFQLTLFNNQQLQEEFKAFLDFTNGYKDFPEDGKVDVSVIKDDSLDNFFEQVEGTTYGYLESIGVITSSDYIKVPYVVEKKFNMFEILMSSVVLYLMVKELAEAVEKLSNAIADVTGLSLFVGTGSTALGVVIMTVLKAILILAYVVILTLAVVELAKTLFETLIPPKRDHLAIPLRTLLKAVCTHFGYNFISPIHFLDEVLFLPSNPNTDEKTAGGFISVTKGTQSGIPNVFDYGYKCDELFTIAKNLFNAKFSIVNGEVHFRSRNDPYWLQQSNWSLPNVLLDTKQYNTEEIKPERLLTFRVDQMDEWTIDNYLGTAYEIRTTQLTTIRKRAVLLKGLEEINFQTSLGTRKDELNALEKFLKKVAGTVDDLTDFFGKPTSFTEKVKGRIGILKQTSNWHTIPKLIYTGGGGRMPVDHRDRWSSKILYDLYHNEKSFVLNNFQGQKTYYKGIRIPFGFEDYKKLTTNSYFYFKGKQAKIIKFEWTIGTDTANIDFWVREPYTYNLAETYINPS
tara:strand:+ start:6944 stop:8716 length:1773 start_codon:yes stop_codon:yes gene_type:complete